MEDSFSMDIGGGGWGEMLGAGCTVSVGSDRNVSNEWGDSGSNLSQQWGSVGSSRRLANLPAPYLLPCSPVLFFFLIYLF